jgi:Animal haem peroxidase
MREKHLEENEFVQEDKDLGYKRTEIVPCRNLTRYHWYDNSNADLITTTARLIADANSSELHSFENNIGCLRNASASLTAHSKYRSVNGFGNNLKNPYWGSTGAPFGRFGPKNYYDKIHTSRRSVSGNLLQSPRKIVQNILLKAEKFHRQSRFPNDMANFAALYITHDLGL